MADGTTQNGWQIDGPRRDYPIPGSSVTLNLTADADMGYLMVYAAARWNKEIEPLKAAQCGGYDTRPIGGLNGDTSNHRSATAMDLNYTDHPQHTHTLTAAQLATLRGIMNATGDCLRAGAFWTEGSLDEQHIEGNTTDRPRLAAAVAALKAGTATDGTPALDIIPFLGNAIDAATGLVLPTLVTGPFVKPQPISGKPLTTDQGALAKIRIAGRKMTGDVAGATTAASMSWSATQVSQLSMTIQDTPDAELTAAAMFEKGRPVDFGDQHMEWRDIAVSAGSDGSPVAVCKARSRVISDMIRQTGEGDWGTVETTQWVSDRCKEVGARFLIQPGLGTYHITRQEGETTWDVLVKLAGALRCWCYEVEQQIVFARPTWLAVRPRTLLWSFTWRSAQNYSNGFVGLASFSDRADVDDPAESQDLQFKLESVDAYRARPGQILHYGGKVGAAAGTWLLSQVDLPLGGPSTQPTITATRVRDPKATGVIGAAP